MRPQGTRQRRLGGTLVAAFAVVAAAATSPAFAAKNDPPPSDPAISVYVERIPTSKGSVAAGRGTANPNTKLPRAAEQGLEQQERETAGALREVATSPSYGAPSTSPQAARAPAQANAEDGSDPAEPPVRSPGRSVERVNPTSVASPAPDYVAESNLVDRRVLGLIVVLLAATAATMAIGSRRRGAR